MRIDIEDVWQIEEELERLNKLDLNEIELYIANEKVEVPKEKIKEWKFTGLDVYHFFKLEAYSNSEDK